MDKISFCFPHYNRLEMSTEKGTLPLFRNCLSTLKNLLDVSPNVDYELSICSFDNDEQYNKLTSFIYNLYPNDKVIFTRSNNNFTIGEGKQLAYQNSTGNIIAFLDADMIFLRPYIIKKAVEICSGGGVYFPICYSFFKEGHGRWRSEGFGNSFTSRKLLDSVQWWVKEEWGEEDIDFLKQMGHKTQNIIRENCPGLYHQNHPPTLSGSRTAFK